MKGSLEPGVPACSFRQKNRGTIGEDMLFKRLPERGRELGLKYLKGLAQEIAAVFGQAVPEGAETWIIGLMSCISRPQIVQVLRVLGRCHPSWEVAKAARKAARRARRQSRAFAWAKITGRRS